MHIAHFTNTYRPVVSGVVRSVSAFRKGQVALGHTVFVFAQDAGDYQDEEPFVFRYPAIELPLHNRFPIAIPSSRFVAKLLPSLKLDVIHAHHPFLLGQAAASRAEELELPLVFTFHTRYRDYSHYVSLSQGMVKDAIDRWLGEFMQHCHHVVVPSESIRQMLADLYGVQEKVTVIPTGIDMEPYESRIERPVRQQRDWGDDRVIISVGRLAKEKNWETLMLAAAEVLREEADVRLVILGDGEQRTDLEELARELGVADRVELPGIVPFEAVPDYLRSADLFCFASVTETQGLVTLEAMAAGLPVVAVKASGTADVVEPGVNGLLTDNTVEGMSRAMIGVLRDDDLRCSLGQAAREKAKLYDVKRQAERLTDVYRVAIADKQAGRTVQVDKHKPLLSGKWYELLGLDKNPLKSFRDALDV